VDRHVRAPSTSTLVPRSFPEYPCSSQNTESYTSPPLRQSPPLTAATPVRMRRCPSPHLPSASPRARPCHTGPLSPTNVVAATPVTPHPSGSRSWPCHLRASTGPVGHLGQRATLVLRGLRSKSGPGLCGGFLFSHLSY
jgi:hypothetical protein